MILETAMRNALANTFDDEVNTGAGTATGQFETTGDVEVATINFQNPAFNSAATGVITLNGVPLSDSSATGGVVGQFSIYDRDAGKEAELTCDTAAAEVIITSTNIAATEQVDLTSLTITVPAS